jgi:peptidoglycan hydrolase-like protein with peptidoglycan-binding domain
MSLIQAPILLGATGPQVTALQTALVALGFAIPPNEAGSALANGTFGPGTQGAVNTFRQRMGLPSVPPGSTPFDGPTARLLNVVVPANETARNVLDTAVRESVATAQGASPLEAEWLARYAIIARDFTVARQAATLAPADPVITTIVQPIIGDPNLQTSNPELQNPENYYSCRFDFVPQDTVDSLLERPGAPASGPPQFYIARRRPAQQDGSDDWPDIPPDLPDPPPPDPDPTIPARLSAIKSSAISWIQAVDFWQKGHREFKQQRYANAINNYDEAEKSAVAYFESFYNLPGPRESVPKRIGQVVAKFAQPESSFAGFWEVIRRRRVALTLSELGQIDGSGYSFTASASDALLKKNKKAETDTTQHAEDTAAEAATRQQVLDRFALLLAAVFVPLARSEANRILRFYSGAIADLQRVQTPFLVAIPRVIVISASDRPPLAVALATATVPPLVTPTSPVQTQSRPVWLTCDFIERAFVQLALAETLFEQAETEYKSDAPADPTLLALPILANEKPSDSPRLGFEFSTHGLRAAQTYLQIIDLFTGTGAYVERVQNGRDELARGASDPNAPRFHAVGKNITLPAKGSNVPTVQSATPSLPGLSRSKSPAEPWVKLVSSVDGQTVTETNPRVYGLLLMTQARLEQIKYNFNYLGYRDDYVPPWRFQFLLERARYFAEHAKSAERDYLNFLNNAEHEEYQELSASQNVELEKANVRIETARVDQAQAEVAASQQSAKLADLNASDAQKRLKNFQDFDTHMSELNSLSFGAGMISFAEGAIELSAGDPRGLSGIASGLSQTATAGKEELQRNLEEDNLKLAVDEANQAKQVALAQLEVTKAGLIVAGLQRQAALLRHEFALQNLTFLRNRQLNSEQWFRLANSIRSISDTYLRYAIQLAFLTEQAYEFEADKRINVIRFDYDLSDVGSYLAADFLLRDLDTIEQDLIVNQQQRQQEVRYVLSMAREFPQTLQDLRDNGRASFSLRLEQIERRFPGLYNARIGSVDLLPVALLDNTRYSVELTHLGSGQVRLKANPDTLDGRGSTSPLNQNDLLIPPDGWLPKLVNDWPIKIRISEPESNVYSGLSRQDAAAAFPVVSAGQRNAFEGLPGASAWEIDMSSRDNAIVPGTLADVLITFALAGYHDPILRDAVEEAEAPSLATTSFISARAAMPDGYYGLVHTGKLEWEIPERMLTLTGTPNALRNLGVLLPLTRQGVELGRCRCRYPVEIDIAADGSTNILTVLPQFTLTSNALTLHGTFSGSNDATVTWDFGDGSALVQGRDVQHSYSRPGPYEVLTRLVRNGRLTEYRSAVYVSKNHSVSPPLIALPTIAAVTPIPATGAIDLTVKLATPMNGVATDCAIGKVRAFATSGSLTLKGIGRGTPGKPNRVVLDFLATPNLSARLYSKQRFLPVEAISISRLRISTNRTFAVDGDTETTTTPNPFTKHVFGANPAQTIISPSDRWTLELPVAENPWFVGVSSSDVTEFDGSELDDAVLSLEYLVQSSA